jgi:hypothetical protein
MDAHNCRDERGETTCALNPDCYSCELEIDHCHGRPEKGDADARP